MESPGRVTKKHITIHTIWRMSPHWEKTEDNSKPRVIERKKKVSPVPPISILLRREDEELGPGPARAGYRVSGSGLAWEAVSIGLVLSRKTSSTLIKIKPLHSISHRQPALPVRRRHFSRHQTSKETSYRQLGQESGLFFLSSVR